VRAVSALSDRLHELGWLAPKVTRRVGLWFVGPKPPRERDLISATRLYQRRGGTAIGWSVDDPARDRPNAKTVQPTVSNATFPVQF
jgi:hypothetical protein